MVSETRRVCRALRPVSGEDGILEIEVPTGCGLLGPTHLFGPAPQWGAADAEIKVPSGENTELKSLE